MTGGVAGHRLVERPRAVPAGGHESDRGCVGRLGFFGGDDTFDLARVRAQHDGKLGTRGHAAEQIQRQVGDILRTPLDGFDVEALVPADREAILAGADQVKQQRAIVADGGIGCLVVPGRGTFQGDPDLR